MVFVFLILLGLGLVYAVMGLAQQNRKRVFAITALVTNILVWLWFIAQVAIHLPE